MQTSYKRLTVVSLFCALVIVLIANAVILRHEYAVQDDNRSKLMDTQQVMRLLGEVDNTITESETGQRGYLYTGREEYLSAYKDGSARVDDRLDRLQQMAANSPAVLEKIPELRQLAHLKMSEMARTIALAES